MKIFDPEKLRGDILKNKELWEAEDYDCNVAR